MKVMAYIGFGSNIGDLLGNFNEAKERLTHTPEVEILRISSLYHTEPLTPHHEEQPWYLNCVFEITTNLKLHALLKALKGIEKTMGRLSHKRWEARRVDLDILFYGNAIYSDEAVHIPHRGIITRRFVLEPLCDLIPDFIHPDLEIPLRELLANTQDRLAVKPFPEEKKQQ